MQDASSTSRPAARGPILAALVGGLCLVLSGCGFTVTVIAVGLSGSGSGGGKKGLAVQSAGFVDVDGDALVGAGDRVVVTFTGDIGVLGAPDADVVFRLEPASGSFGAGAVVTPGATGRQVEIELADGADLEPNGRHGSDPGSTGIDIDPAQTDLVSPKGKLPRTRSAPADLQGEMAPRIVAVELEDADFDCIADETEILKLRFSRPVTLLVDDPALAFESKITGDGFGAGAAFVGGVGPTAVSVVEIELGVNPVLEPRGQYDPSTTTAGSPSGIDLKDMALAVVDAAFPWLPAQRSTPDLVDVELGFAWISSGDDLPDHGFGTVVATAGDREGDGNLDFLVGVPRSDSDGGRVHLFGFGGVPPSGLVERTTAVGEPQPGERFGSAIASGVLGGPSLDTDLFVGAPGYDGGLALEGRVYVYYDTAPDLGTPSLVLTGPTTGNARFGASLASGGDVDEVGLDDLVVGAPGAGGGGTTYLYLSQPGGSLVDLPDWSVSPPGLGSEFGASVAISPTVDNVPVELTADVIVGAPLTGLTTKPGAAYAYYGRATMVPDTTPSWSSRGDDQDQSRFGEVVAAVGDVDGDGFGDVLVSAPRFDTATSPNAGKVYLFLGSPSGLSPSPNWASTGDDEPSALFGSALAGVGDVNADGRSDVLIGAPGTPLGPMGRVYLYTGTPTGLALQPEQVWEMDGQVGARFGASVASAGNLLKGDPTEEILIGAPGHDTLNVDAGLAVLIQLCRP